jgi:hypothetical protein
MSLSCRPSYCIGKIASTYNAHAIEFGLAYRSQTVKATSGRAFAAKIRSGKRGRGVIVLPGPIG